MGTSGSVIDRWDTDVNVISCGGFVTAKDVGSRESRLEVSAESSSDDGLGILRRGIEGPLDGLGRCPCEVRHEGLVIYRTVFLLQGRANFSSSINGEGGINMIYIIVCIGFL